MLERAKREALRRGEQGLQQHTNLRGTKVTDDIELEKLRQKQMSEHYGSIMNTPDPVEQRLPYWWEETEKALKEANYASWFDENGQIDGDKIRKRILNSAFKRGVKTQSGAVVQLVANQVLPDEDDGIPASMKNILKLEGGVALIRDDVDEFMRCYSPEDVGEVGVDVVAEIIMWISGAVAAKASKAGKALDAASDGARVANKLDDIPRVPRPEFARKDPQVYVPDLSPVIG